MSNQKSQLFEMVNEDRVIRNLEQMISIDSVIGRESELAEYIGQQLAEIGTDPKFQEVNGGRKNVYSTYRPDSPGPLITLNGHTDTVPACEGWKGDPFSPRHKDGRIYGLGAVDMKAGLACALEAYRILVEADLDLRGDIAYSAVIDEEGYSSGAKELLNSELGNSDAILIGEPHFGTADGVVPLGITGKVLYEITAKGRSAHGFRPHEGINAVEDLAALLSHLEQLPLVDHPDFGQGNTCTLKFEGGYEEYNVSVPDLARAEINRLLVPGESIDSALADMEQLVQDLQLESNLEVENKPPSYEPITQQKTQPLFQDLINNYQLVLRREPEFGFVKGIMDANVFVNRGEIPTVVLGPDGGNLHGAEEYVTIETLKPVTEIYLGTIIDFLSP